MIYVLLTKPSAADDLAYFPQRSKTQFQMRLVFSLESHFKAIFCTATKRIFPASIEKISGKLVRTTPFSAPRYDTAFIAVSWMCLAHTGIVHSKPRLHMLESGLRTTHIVPLFHPSSTLWQPFTPYENLP